MTMSRVGKVGLAVMVLMLIVIMSTYAAEKPTPVDVPSINDQAQNSRLGSMHWNMFRNQITNADDPEQGHCISCHSAVAIVDDPDAELTDFLKAGQEYCYEEVDDPANGQSPFLYTTATEDGKYFDNDLEGITCRVCHVMDKDGLTLRRPDNTCTLCHGRSFNWDRGSGHHVEQAFFSGQGDGYWDPSVHYTIGMQCQDCHTMNAIKHDYESAAPADIVTNAKCQNCHYDANELADTIETTQTKVMGAIEEVDARIKAAEAAITDGSLDEATQKLVSDAQARITFIEDDFSEGVHNPQFAAKLVNEANASLDAFDKAMGKETKTKAFDLSGLSVFSQAQASRLGAAHWDMLENQLNNFGHAEKDNCVVCHSAVSIVDDPKAKMSDFLPADSKYWSDELGDWAMTEEDGKYLANHEEGITCRVCHVLGNDGDIVLRRNDEQTCGLCHGRDFNWQTGSAHHVELSFMKGQGSEEKGVPAMPSFKYEMGFACQDCHFMDETKHDFEPATPKQIAASSKCSPCHTESDVGAYITGIQDEVETGIASLEPRLEEAKAYVDANPKDLKAKELYTQAKASVAFIEDDFSEGVHNPDFARYLLERAGKLLDDFDKCTADSQ